MAQQAIVGEKVGMTQVWAADNRIVPVTVLRVEPARVVQVKTTERDGYTALQVTYGTKDAKKLTKPEAGHFAKAGVPPRRYTLELRTADASSYAPGQEITGELFAPSEDGGKLVKVDVVATSKGKGYAGVMKRHNFKGLGAGHGVQRKHRSPGSIGGCATPGRVFKGLRMAGRMGNERVTTQNLTVHAVDAEKGLLLIKGAVPCNKYGLVLVKTATKGGAL